MAYRGQAVKVDVTSGAESPKAIKVWAGTATSNSNGSWSVDLSSAKFARILSATATAQLDTNTATNVPIAGIRNYTVNQVNGWVVQSNSFMFLLGGSGAGLKFCTTPITIHIQVIGL